MKRMALMATFVAAGALALLGGRTAAADGGTAVSVKPLIPKPGDVITVKGDRLGANSQVEVRVLGPGGVNIDLGEVKADAAGDFTAEFTLPASLAVGTYQIQAKGAETVTTQITVKAAGAGTATEMAPAPVLRSRSFGQAAVLVAIFGVLAGLGIFFARTAHREARA